MQVMEEKSAGIGVVAAVAKVAEGDAGAAAPYEAVRRLAGENAVVVFSMSGCCMCTVAKRLLFSLGVGPTVVELDLLPGATGADVQAVLFQLSSSSSSSSRMQIHGPPIPAVFVGGKFLGGVDTLMDSHINGSLVPLLKDAGALWL